MFVNLCCPILNLGDIGQASLLSDAQSVKWDMLQACGQMEVEEERGWWEKLRAGGARISICWFKSWPPCQSGAAAHFIAQETEALEQPWCTHGWVEPL